MKRGRGPERLPYLTGFEGVHGGGRAVGGISHDVVMEARAFGFWGSSRVASEH